MLQVSLNLSVKIGVNTRKSHFDPTILANIVKKILTVYLFIDNLQMFVNIRKLKLMLTNEAEASSTWRSRPREGSKAMRPYT